MASGSIKQRHSILIIFAFLLISCLCWPAKGSSQQAKDEVKRTSVIKEVTGEVTWLRKNRIVIVFKRDKEHGTEEEMLLPIAEDVRIIHKKKLDEISAGDTVMVQYEELTEEWPDGKKSRQLVAKTITFLHPAMGKKSGEGVLRSE
jgi:hypothetical protein